MSIMSMKSQTSNNVHYILVVPSLGQYNSHFHQTNQSSQVKKKKNCSTISPRRGRRQWRRLLHRRCSRARASTAATRLHGCRFPPQPRLSSWASLWLSSTVATFLHRGGSRPREIGSCDSFSSTGNGSLGQFGIASGGCF